MKTAMITVDVPESLANAVEELWGTGGAVWNEVVTEALDAKVRALGKVDWSAESEWVEKHPLTVAYYKEG